MEKLNEVRKTIHDYNKKYLNEVSTLGKIYDELDYANLNNKMLKNAVERFKNVKEMLERELANSGSLAIIIAGALTLIGIQVFSNINPILITLASMGAGTLSGIIKYSIKKQLIISPLKPFKDKTPKEVAESLEKSNVYINELNKQRIVIQDTLECYRGEIFQAKCKERQLTETLNPSHNPQIENEPIKGISYSKRI